MVALITSRNFGTLPNGSPVEAWTLRGRNGFELEFLSYGGIVTRLLAPDRHGALADIVLGFDSLAPYLTRHPYFGSIVGRVAGRIPGAKFHLDGKLYRLAANEPPNHLHGGLDGFDRKIWRVTPVQGSRDEASVRLEYCSCDGEEGYPGTVNISVIYTVTAENAFVIESEAQSDKSTPFSLTHHSYFNLAGENAGSIAEHELQIHADEAVLTNQTLAPLGKLISVAREINDFNTPRRLSEAIPKLFQQAGDLYRVRRPTNLVSVSRVVETARLAHPGTGRVLSVRTTEPYLQLYTGARLNGSFIGKSGTPYRQHAGLCLECEGYSAGTNSSEPDDIILRPGVPRRSQTIYAFSVNHSEAQFSLESQHTLDGTGS